MTETVYRCFHCKQDIVGDQAAELHFGSEPTASPQCWTYPANMRSILNQNAELRWFAEQIFNGIDTHTIDVSSPADETLEFVLRRGRAAVAEGVIDPRPKRRSTEFIGDQGVTK